MSNFRTKFLGLAAVASAFAGVSYGQVVSGCTSPQPALNIVVRAESETELVSDASVTACTNTVATTATVSLTLSVPATSKAFTPPALAPGNTDAALFVYPGAVPAVPGTGALSGPYFGAISTTNPNVITFTGVALPAAGFSLGFSNVRGNAVGAAAIQVTATPSIIYSAGAVSSSVGGLTAENVAFIQPSLAATSLAPLTAVSPTTVTNFTVCGGNFIGGTAPALGSAAFIVNIKELFTGAFKAQLAENGSFVPGGGSAVGVASGPDQILITLGNIPATATVFVPQTLTPSAGTTLTLLNSTAVTSPAGLSTTPTSVPVVLEAQAPFVAFTPSNGGVTITYTVSGVSSGAASFTVPTFITFAANSATAQGPITITESYGPTGTVTGPAASVPTFAASSATPLNGSSVLLCQTSLLFPFVTNQLGFDTGIVIANTSTDALGAGGKSSVTGQTGSCVLSFFGAGTPTPATGVADPQGALPTAITHAFTISQVAPGFQGYMIATCPMLYIHGFAFLAYNLTQNNGAVEGYLAEVLTRTGAGDAVTF